MALHLVGGVLEFFVPAVIVPWPVLEIEDEGHQVHEAPEAELLQDEPAIIPCAMIRIPKGPQVEATMVLQEVQRRQAVQPLVWRYREQRPEQGVAVALRLGEEVEAGQARAQAELVLEAPDPKLGLLPVEHFSAVRGFALILVSVALACAQE